MRNTTSYTLLCILSTQPMNGYMMKRWVDRILCHFWKISYGQLYPTLKKLQEEGLVEVENRTSPIAPPSKYYHITQKGLDELKQWLMEDTLDFNYRDESLMKFYFSALLPIDEVIDKAQRALEFQQQILDDYNKDKIRMETERPKPTRRELMIYITTKKGIYLNEARLKWAQECIEILEDYKQKYGEDIKDE